eukprot:CAMPEP_0182444276 /NCGR_PEP_ID=MMETSP1172-20130603/2780_1 /TAXON_ID=708627 /ORGANISM="Timspurckia oligopyrenoides, Strain CCMP3278" /LENGTH=378 /DNA_ID=CAMNT_0024639799 /DNA_START=516 /DNA_END=1652 /DNA_ORIENTATION=+
MSESHRITCLACVRPLAFAVYVTEIFSLEGTFRESVTSLGVSERDSALYHNRASSLEFRIELNRLLQEAMQRNLFSKYGSFVYDDEEVQILHNSLGPTPHVTQDTEGQQSIGSPCESTDTVVIHEESTTQPTFNSSFDSTTNIPLQTCSPNTLALLWLLYSYSAGAVSENLMFYLLHDRSSTLVSAAFAFTVIGFGYLVGDVVFSRLRQHVNAFIPFIPELEVNNDSRNATNDAADVVYFGGSRKREDLRRLSQYSRTICLGCCVLALGFGYCDYVQWSLTQWTLFSMISAMFLLTVVQALGTELGVYIAPANSASILNVFLSRQVGYALGAFCTTVFRWYFHSYIIPSVIAMVVLITALSITLHTCSVLASSPETHL